MTVRICDMAIFIEFLAGSALALFFHFGLHEPQSASIIFGVGVLLSLATWLLREDLGHARQELVATYNHAHDITFAVAGISDPECLAKANEIMAGLKRTLGLLQQGYIPLEESEFYMRSARYTDEATDRVRAVDPITTGWESRGALVNYYQANVRALARGVSITRIFIVNRGEMEDERIQKLLLAQHRDGIQVRVAFREELPGLSDATGRDTTGSYDFALYDDRVATEVFGQPGKYFGRKTRELSLIRNYQSLFDLIAHSSHPIGTDAEGVIFHTADTDQLRRSLPTAFRA